MGVQETRKRNEEIVCSDQEANYDIDTSCVIIMTGNVCTADWINGRDDSATRMWRLPCTEGVQFLLQRCDNHLFIHVHLS